MKFYRIYVELTGVCGLSCSFCPSFSLPKQQMDLTFFASVVKQAQAYTKEISCHVLGDPLTLSDLSKYLDVLHHYNMKANLTTSGYFFKKHTYETLFHPTVKQINISLNAYNKNEGNLSLEAYMAPILELCQEKLKRKNELFINLRVWNLDENMNERGFNEKLFALLEKTFNVALDLDAVYAQRPKSIRLERKILLHFDDYFEWPSLNNPVYGDGTCQGMQSHCAVLANGTVVPCCLDCEGIVALGNLHEQSLKEILESPRANALVEGFKTGRAVEELCQKCSYKSRFEKS